MLGSFPPELVVVSQQPVYSGRRSRRCHVISLQTGCRVAKSNACRRGGDLRLFFRARAPEPALSLVEGLDLETADNTNTDREAVLSHIPYSLRVPHPLCVLCAKGGRPLTSIATLNTPAESALAPSSNRPKNQQCLPPLRHCLRQLGIHRFVRPVLFARKNAHERPSLPRSMFANRPAQHWVARLQHIQNSTHRNRRLNLERNLSTIDTSQGPQVVRQHHANRRPACALRFRQVSLAQSLGNGPTPTVGT